MEKWRIFQENIKYFIAVYQTGGFDNLKKRIKLPDNIEEALLKAANAKDMVEFLAYYNHFGEILRALMSFYCQFNYTIN